ncbi:MULTISPECIES: phosphotransferase family protein [Micromonospora]|uniref:phosphotransferase family protein n=1 Tax=Micromonospora TaxID=1873 RepID=UPI000D703A43|nr:aminoglycoside phosphotransferase family protein [Micromonospora sp. S4605]PWU50490.1 aminoglycoside phosphotransferase family protein [Micromonospora sp. S4605]
MSGPSPTQRVLSPADVADYVRASLGPDRGVAACGPLTGGGYAAVWWVRLDDGREVVLKVAPPPAVPLLRYERGLAAAEARYFRLAATHAPGVPVPPVLHHGVHPRLGEWLVTGRLPGRSLSDLASSGVDGGRARYDFGTALATVHRVTGDRFGYDDGRTGGSTWAEAFAAMIEDLLADAADWRVPVPVERIRSAVRLHRRLLDQVRRPALVHFDGWDGNVLAEPDGDGPYRMCGLVDGERYLFGDPMVDLVSPLLLRRAEDEPDHPFLRGYAAATDDPPVFDAGLRRRLGLYRMHLYLLMIVEMPSRGMTPASHPDRHDGLARLLDEELTALSHD